MAKLNFKCPKFRGEELKFNKRASTQHINKRNEERFWSGVENVIYEIESDTIKKHIESTLKNLFEEKKEKEIELKEIDNKWEYIKRDIEQYYQRQERELSPNEESFIQKNKGKSYGAGVALTIAFLFAVALEIIVMIAQSVAIALSEGGYIDYPSIVVALFMGVLLAIGGWSVGRFLGPWWFDNELDRNNLAQYASLERKDWFFLGLGIVLVLFVGIMRFVAGGGIYALAVTLILGSMVAILEASREYYGGMRCFLGQLRLEYLIIDATKKHIINMDQYKQFFYNKVDELSRVYKVKIIKEGTA